MNLEELRAVLKVLDLELASLANTSRRFEGLHDAMSDLAEYLLKQHATIERLQSRVHVLAERANLK